MLKDLTAYLSPGLDLTLGDHTYHVDPPSKDTGIKLAAINAMSISVWAKLTEACPTCGRSGSPDTPPETLALVESMGNVELGELSLGAVYGQMVADGVPGAHIDQAAVYALYYWTLGADVADQIIATQAGEAAGEVGSGSSTSKRGPRTASDHLTKRISTRGTGASQPA